MGYQDENRYIGSLWNAGDYEIIATTRNEDLFEEKKNIEWKVFDAQKFESNELENILKGCDWIINCIGLIKSYINDNNYLNVKQALEINALFPCQLASLAEKLNVKVIQIATDCVYDGIKGEYIETDKHNALDVYGKTKSLGEVYSDHIINLRCSIIGPEKKGKSSLLEWFLNQPKGTTINGYTNHLWNGLTTYHFAKICMGIVKNNTDIKLQHIIPSNYLSKYDLVSQFAKVYAKEWEIKVIPIQTNISIDRRISTNNTERNKMLWKYAGYSSIPTIERMISEMHSSFLGN